MHSNRGRLHTRADEMGVFQRLTPPSASAWLGSQFSDPSPSKYVAPLGEQAGRLQSGTSASIARPSSMLYNVWFFC